MKSLEETFAGCKRLVRDDQTPDGYLADILGAAYAEYREMFATVGTAKWSVPDFPMQLDFQLNNRCNLRCPMCYWAKPDELEDWSDPKSEFPFDRFAEIVREGVESGHLRAINFEGLNEPLMKKDLDKYIRFAKDAGVVDMSLHTNGLLLTREWSERLIESGLTKLMVSLDAFSAETFKITRTSARYDRVLDNIATFLKVRCEKQAPMPLLRTSFVVQPSNIHEKDAFVSFWSRYADWVQIQELIDETNIVSPASYTGTKGPKVCPQPFYRMSVKTNGEVFPCCCSLGHKFLAIGDVAKSDMKSLWKSDHFEMVRTKHAEGKYAEIEACRICLDNVYGEGD